MAFTRGVFVAPFALAFMLAPVQAFAGDEETTAATEQTQTASASEEDPDEVICKTKKLTGSRLKAKKVCKTREEWNNTFNAFRAVNDMQNGATANGER